MTFQLDMFPKLRKEKSIRITLPVDNRIYTLSTFKLIMSRFWRTVWNIREKRTAFERVWSKVRWG